MSNFTAGPWHRNIAPARKYPTIFAGRNIHICQLSNDTAVPDDAMEANCNLITAAPDLYYALRCIMEEMPVKRDWLDPVTEAIAKQALAQAEGN